MEKPQRLPPRRCCAGVEGLLMGPGALLRQRMRQHTSCALGRGSNGAKHGERMHGSSSGARTMQYREMALKKKRQDLPASLWRSVAGAEHEGTCACGEEQRELASPSWGMQPDPAASLASEGQDLPGHVLPRHARRSAAAPAKDAVSQGKAICPLNFGSSSPSLAGALCRACMAIIIIFIIIIIIIALKAERKHWVLGQHFSTKGLRGDALSSSTSG